MWLTVIVSISLFVGFVLLNDLRIKYLLESESSENNHKVKTLNFILIFFGGGIWFFFLQAFDAMKGAFESESALWAYKLITFIIIIGSFTVIKFVLHRNIYNRSF